MNLGSCHAPAWVPSKIPANSAWAAAKRIRGQLCRLCDLALDAKDSGKISRIRYHELKILHSLHGDFDRLNLNTAHCTSAAECDVCRLARAAKRMVLSAYAEEYTDFIRTTRETPDGMTARVERDFGTDFRRYIVRSGLPEYAKGYKLMARAELVAQYLAAAEKPGDLQPVAEEQVAECKAAPASQLKDYSSLKGVTNRLDSLHVRIMTLSGPQLRIVR